MASIASRGNLVCCLCALYIFESSSVTTCSGQRDATSPSGVCRELSDDTNLLQLSVRTVAKRSKLPSAALLREVHQTAGYSQPSTVASTPLLEDTLNVAQTAQTLTPRMLEPQLENISQNRNASLEYLPPAHLSSPEGFSSLLGINTVCQWFNHQGHYVYRHGPGFVIIFVLVGILMCCIFASSVAADRPGDSGMRRKRFSWDVGCGDSRDEMVGGGGGGWWDTGS